MNLKLLPLLPLVVFGTWLLAHWPGLFNYDTYFVLNELYDFKLNDWFSYIYSLYLMALGQPWISIGFAGLFQATAAALLSAYFVIRIHRMGCPKVIALLGFCLFALSPTNAMFTMHYIYDWPATWLQLTIAMTLGFSLWDFRYEKRGLSNRYLFFLAVALGVLIRLRSDNFPMAILIPLILFYGFRLSRKQWRAFALPLAGTALTVFFILPSALPMARYDDYGVTTFINPLAYILAKSQHDQKQSPEAEQERQIIDKVVDYKMLLAERSDFEIPTFHKGGIRIHSARERREFYWLSAKIFVRHFNYYLANRVRLFRAISGEYATIYTPDGLLDDYPFALEVKERLGIKKASRWPELFRPLKKIEQTVYYSSGVIHYFFASAYLGLILCFALLFWCRRLSCSFLVAALMASRIPLVFLFAPASLFKYVYGIYLLPFFLIPLVILEYRKTSGPKSSGKVRTY